MALTLEDRFAGCLLGLAVGDGLGAYFEGRSPEGIGDRYRSWQALVEHPPHDDLWYTDDTQMAIGVAESLVANGKIVEEHLCRCFVENYHPDRGYGRGARIILEAMEAGDDYKYLAENYFPGGSFGNGAAMRAAPLGLAFRGNLAELLHQTRLASLPTHTHPLGIEGAQLIAYAVALACESERFDTVNFVERLVGVCTQIEFSGPLSRIPSVTDPRDLALFGNGIAAADSVVTAIASFALTPDDFGATIGNAILLGGDTDTLAAMAGAISGAYLGRDAIPTRLVHGLESGPKGREYLESLAEQLAARFGD